MYRNKSPKTKSLGLILPVIRVKSSGKTFRQVRLFSYRIDRNLFLISSFSFISYYTVYESEQSVISSASYVQTRMDLSSTLSVKDVAGFNKLSSVCSFWRPSLLDSESRPFFVEPTPFFMSEKN